MDVTPAISVVVVVHNMAREAPRTLYSLSATYQRHIKADDYEVIVVDNGSQQPFDVTVLDGLAGNFRLIRLDPAPPSPARAINRGLAEARGRVIGVMTDGARIATPGFIHFAGRGVGLYPHAVVATLGWYLGRDYQRWAMEAGYDQNREDRLLASIDWPRDGYRLFEIGAFDESSVDGWFAQIAESNGLFMSRECWNLLGGVEERFDEAGGGFINFDTLTRANNLPGSELVILLGEATFHQFHGGIATNADYRTFPPTLARWSAQYEAIRGEPAHAPPPHNRTYLGVLPPAVLPHFARSMVEPARGLPLGPTFDRMLWSPSPSPRPADPICAALLDLAESEFRDRHFEASAAVARMARSRAPDEPGPQRLLANAGHWLREKDPPDDRRAGFHFAQAKAYRLLGDAAAAETEFQKALEWGADLSEAHTGLSQLRLPGEDYLAWLERLHSALTPATYLEIGIFRGDSLALARPPTRAIGIDPAPQIQKPFTAETHIYCETSDVFFAESRLVRLLDGRPLDLAFIDGLHLFEQALKDFMYVETYCGANSVILLHDTIPLDEVSQRRTQETRFYTGDVWKVVLCLKHYRPDLDISTIAAPPTGLTVVTGLDPASRRLEGSYQEAVARFIDTPYSEIENNLAVLNVVPNDWHIVEGRLKPSRVL